MRWSDEKVLTLRRMAIEGFSAREIKEELGDIFSRSAVLAKASRLKIKLYGNIRFFKKRKA